MIKGEKVMLTIYLMGLINLIKSIFLSKHNFNIYFICECFKKQKCDFHCSIPKIVRQPSGLNNELEAPCLCVYAH